LNFIPPTETEKRKEAVQKTNDMGSFAIQASKELCLGEKKVKHIEIEISSGEK